MKQHKRVERLRRRQDAWQLMYAEANDKRWFVRAYKKPGSLKK